MNRMTQHLQSICHVWRFPGRVGHTQEPVPCVQCARLLHRYLPTIGCLEVERGGVLSDQGKLTIAKERARSSFRPPWDVNWTCFREGDCRRSGDTILLTCVPPGMCGRGSLPACFRHWDPRSWSWPSLQGGAVFAARVPLSWTALLGDGEP